MLGDESAVALGDFGQQRLATAPASADLDFAADADSLMSSPLGPLVQAVEQEEAQRSWVNRSSHDPLDAAACEDRTHRTRFTREDDDAHRVSLFHVIEALDQELRTRNDQRRAVVRAHIGHPGRSFYERQPELGEQLADVGQLPVVDDQRLLRRKHVDRVPAPRSRSGGSHTGIGQKCVGLKRFAAPSGSASSRNKSYNYL